MSVKNWNCDGDQCRSARGEVRALPHGSNTNGAHDILCRSCFAHEINYRRERNKELSKDAAYDLPAWEDLRVYLDINGNTPE